MNKKIIGACMALAAFAAFAVMPAMASASPVLTHPTGTKMGTCVACIKGTQVGTSQLTDTAGNKLLECTTGTMTGDLSKNTGTEIEGTITDATFGGTGATAAGEPAAECTGSFGNASVTALVSEKNPWCLKSTGGDNFSVTGGDCPGGGRIKFILNSTTVGACEFESTAAGVAGTFTTHSTGDAILTVTSSGFSKIAGSFLCPSSGHLKMAFTLETKTLSTEPIYIS